jgi:hypothetical protein
VVAQIQSEINEKRKEVWAMKFDDHLLAGLFIGITVGLHYGASLNAFMPIFLVLGILYLFRYVTAKR